MNLKYIYTLFTLVLALSFVPVYAQTTQKAKKPAAKSVKKKPAKTAATQQKANAKSLGDAAAKTTADTTKKGSQANNAGGGSLSEEIVVTTAYKPVLADAVKIRRNPEMEDKIPFKAPLTYNGLIDKRLEKNEDIKQLSAMKIPAEKDSALMPNYVKLGLGNLKTTYGEAYITNG